MAAGLLVTLAPVASAADSTTYLEGVTSAGDVAVGGGKVFVAADDRIVVADAQGTPKGAITGVSGAVGLAVTPNGTRLYAALSGSNEVAEIDTAALTIVRRIDVAAYPCPSNLSLSGDRLWVGYGCRFMLNGGVLSLDLSATAPTPEPVAGSASTHSAPLVAAAGGTLVIGETDISSADLMVYDVSVTPAVPRGEIDGHTHNHSFLDDLAITPDGSMAIPVFGGSQYDGWDTTSLTRVRSYGVNTADDFSRAVAISSDGVHIAGGRGGGTSVVLYETATAAKTYTNNSLAGDLVPGSLVLSGTDVFGVLKQFSTGRFHLWRLHGVTLPPSTMTLTAPTSTTVLEPFTMTGKLVPANGSAPGAQPLTVTRRLLHGTNPRLTTLAGVTTAADGTFTVTDTPPVGETFVYRVVWDGGPDSRWSAASATVIVNRRKSSLTLSGPASGTVGGQLQFSGALSIAGHAPPPNAVLAVVRTVSTGSGTDETVLPMVSAAGDGSFTFVDEPTESGQYTYLVRWPGNGVLSSAGIAHRVTVHE
ncbi:YVTN family beta-propeller protein [Streptosporangium becharense]|uniref:YVTN family beta-propeller protein n=1 Tax=Streptosporangium becharense TaxID=1816182 RepID=A0A7W9MHW6_9ACTN|nr:hypothetical protein [Streptosporangium becharense]MBB2911395.1 YVTN family beta-propeller protein [Streptosporangium becharense]MBB5821547.1 YVTN family beta-propeller protein [Streptosporangium becharense]